MKRLLLFLLLFVSLGATPTWAEPKAEQTTIVLLDTSGSMRGEKLKDAKALLLNTMKANISNLEIYTFAEAISRISTIGRSDQEVAFEIDGISAGSRTSLYDTLSYLIPIAEETKAPIIVVSDGGDSQSSTDLQSLISLLNSGNVPVSFLQSFIDPKYDSATNAIIEASGGKLLSSIPIPEQRSALKANEDSRDLSWPISIACAGALLTLLIGNFSRNRVLAHRRLELDKQMLLESTNTSIQSGVSAVRNISESFKTRFSLLPQFMSAREKQVTLGISFLFLTVTLAITRNALFAIIATPLLVILGWQLRIKRKHSRQISAFQKELPGALKMLAGSLTAGLSFLQALDAYAEDGQEISAKEFRRALGEIQLGVPIERALESVATRMKSDDLKWAVSAFAIQREVGGSLATILNSTAETIESRFELLREIQTLSAEGRISSYILMALPIGIFIFLAVIRPEYVGVFLTDPLGNLLLAMTGLGLIAAWIWMRKLVGISI